MLSAPAPDRSLSAVLVRAFLFCAAAYVAAFVLAYLAAGIWRGSGGAGGGSFLDRAAWTAYLLLVTAVPAAFGFAVTASVWPFFRALSPSRVAWIAAAAGVAAYLAQTTGVAGILSWIPLPFSGALGPIGAALRMLLPGIAVGVLALFAARAFGSRTASSPPTN